jgi:uncharacterized repeat protein (TIGR02543 family)
MKNKRVFFAVSALVTLTLASCGSPNASIASSSSSSSSFSSEEVIVRYSLTYHLNGGTLAKENPTYYSIKTPTFTLTNPSKEGYTFAGWTSELSATPVVEMTLKRGTASKNLTFEATYTPNTYTVNLYPNGGSGIEKTTYTFTYGEPYTLPTPTQENYHFLGWQNNGTTYPESGTWIYSKDLDLIAAWQGVDCLIDLHALSADSPVVITFTDESGTTISQSKLTGYGQTLAWPSDPSGWDVFRGWANPDGSFFKFDSTFTGDMTLKAVFAKNNNREGAETIRLFCPFKDQKASLSWDIHGAYNSVSVYGGGSNYYQSTGNRDSASGGKDVAMTAYCTYEVYHSWIDGTDPKTGQTISNKGWVALQVGAYDPSKPASTATLAYDPSIEAPVAHKSVHYGAPVALPASLISGYTLQGFYSEKNGAGELIAGPSGSVDHWNRAEKTTIYPYYTKNA